jgi:hypothetical protein
LALGDVDNHVAVIRRRRRNCVICHLKNRGEVTALGRSPVCASLSPLAADKIVMPSNYSCSFMARRASRWAAPATCARWDDLDRIDRSLIATYTSRAKTTAGVKADGRK